MSAGVFAKVHGAATHVPIALVCTSWLFDFAAQIWSRRNAAEEFSAVGYWTLLIGALGTVPAVLSGLWMSRGVMWGQGLVRWHHLFVWPAFALTVALAVWRIQRHRGGGHSVTRGYLIFSGIAVVLILGGGYWGGELLLAT